MVQSTQFGSYCDTAEYDSKVNTLSVAVDYQATEKLSLNAGVTYNKAEDSWDWDFEDRSTLLFTPSPVTDAGATPNPGYDTWDQNDEIDDYSDLTYEQYQFTVGGTYNFTATCYTTASVTYDVFNSEEDYVYGDEDGDALYGYLGFGYRF
jgi:long-subunit fatty acid transport protein